jgi:hypothetical protein
MTSTPALKQTLAQTQVIQVAPRGQRKGKRRGSGSTAGKPS